MKKTATKGAKTEVKGANIGAKPAKNAAKTARPNAQKSFPGAREPFPSAQESFLGAWEPFPDAQKSFPDAETEDFGREFSAFHVHTLKDQRDQTPVRLPPEAFFKVLCLVRSRLSEFTNRERTYQRDFKECLRRTTCRCIVLLLCALTVIKFTNQERTYQRTLKNASGGATCRCIVQRAAGPQLLMLTAFDSPLEVDRPKDRETTAMQRHVAHFLLTDP